MHLILANCGRDHKFGCSTHDLKYFVSDEYHVELAACKLFVWYDNTAEKGLMTLLDCPLEVSTWKAIIIIIIIIWF